MPVFRFLLVMAPALLALLLFIAPQLPPPGPMPNSSNFYGLRAPPHTAKPTHLTVTAAPEPDMRSAAVLAAEPDALASAQPTATAQTALKPAATAKTSPKRKRVVRHNWRHDYAAANPWFWGRTSSQMW
jgi:hypothetical protein